jgi:hypothetical protein
MSKRKRWDGDYQQMISLHPDAVTIRTSMFVWRFLVVEASQYHRTVRMLTHTLPEMRFFLEHVPPHMNFAHWEVIAHEKERAKAQAIKNAYPSLRIAVHQHMHSKVALVEPDRVYISSGNLGSNGFHETMIEMISKLAHDWYLQTVFMPLWRESQEMQKEES